jgi:hypothetical protein
MITYKKKFNEKEFYIFFLKLYNLSQNTSKLTSYEIILLAEMMIDVNCIYGKRREELRSRLEWGVAHLSNSIKSLEQKSFIVKTGVKKYSLNYNLTKLKELYSKTADIDILFKITKNNDSS